MPDRFDSAARWVVGTDGSSRADKAVMWAAKHVTVEAPLGSPEDALVAASRTDGLVVVGSRGRGGLTGLRLSPVTRHVLRGTQCPVVVTRAYAGWKDHSGRGGMPVAAH